MPKLGMPAPSPSAPPATSKLDTSQGNATAALYSAAIGPISVDFYLPIFTRFEAASRQPLTWNWAASLYTVNWMIFRGLGLAALAYAATVAGAVLLLFGLGRMIFQWSPGTELALLATLVVLMFGVPGLLGNCLLHTACRKKMAHALRESTTLAEACALLTQQASSRRRFLSLVAVNALAVAAALALYGWSTLQASESELPAVQPGPALSIRTQPIETAGLPTTAVPLPPMQSGLVTHADPPVTVAPETPLRATSDPQPAPAPDTTAVPAAAPVLPSEPPTTTAQARPAIEARPTPPTRQRYYINVGLFAKEANAQNALNKLERAGLSTLSSTVSTPQGERTRVRAGPFNSEREAKAAAKIIRSLHLDAVVMQQTS